MRIVGTPRLERTFAVVQYVAGAWFFAAFIAMFFSAGRPALAAFATWTFRIYVGIVALFALGLVLWVVFAGARNVIDLYRTMMAIQPMGLVGRVFWAVVMAALFVAALLFIRL